MVSSSNLDDLEEAFISYKKLESPDMFSYCGEVVDALFDINTIDAYVAGLVSKVLDGKSLTHEEIAGIPVQLFDDNGFSLVAINNSRKPISLKDFPDVLHYAKALENLRILLVVALSRHPS